MIRAASMDDLTPLAELAALLWPDAGFDELKKEMEQNLLNENAVVAICCDRGVPVGFAQCHLRHDYVEGTASSPVGYLEGIYVDAAHRRQGLASELLRFCEDWSRARGCAEFGSDCELDNTDSYRFHKKMGFFEANRIICFHKSI